MEINHIWITLKYTMMKREWQLIYLIMDPLIIINPIYFTKLMMLLTHLVLNKISIFSQSNTIKQITIIITTSHSIESIQTLSYKASKDK